MKTVLFPVLCIITFGCSSNYPKRLYFIENDYLRKISITEDSTFKYRVTGEYRSYPLSDSVFPLGDGPERFYFNCKIEDKREETISPV